MITPEQIVMRRLEREIARLGRENERLEEKMRVARSAVKNLLRELAPHLPSWLRQAVEKMIGNI